MDAIRAAILTGGCDLERCEYAAGKPLSEISRTVRVGPTEGLRTGSIAGTRILRAAIVLPARPPCIDGIEGYCVSHYEL